MHACTYKVLTIHLEYKSLYHYSAAIMRLSKIVMTWYYEIDWKEHKIQKSFRMLTTWYTQLGAWPNTRRSPVRLATPSARATAEPFSSSVNRAAIKSTRMWKLLMSVFSVWVFPKMFSPNHANIIGCSIINHPFWDTPICGNGHMFIFPWYCFAVDLIRLMDATLGLGDNWAQCFTDYLFKESE